jgi:hypothetical protein
MLGWWLVARRAIGMNKIHTRKEVTFVVLNAEGKKVLTETQPHEFVEYPDPIVGQRLGVWLKDDIRYDAEVIKVVGSREITRDFYTCHVHLRLPEGVAI